MLGKRIAEITRKTTETEINLTLNLDGSGRYEIETGIPFFDHMLASYARHGKFDLVLNALGDVHIDGHHTVEDVGICLGQALDICWGDKKGIKRYGHSIIPMDEALILCAIDISGRSFLAFDVEFPSSRVGDFDTELVEEFLRALAVNARINLHVKKLAGRNCHHIIEGIFKSLGITLSGAASITAGDSIPSTKGVL